MKTKEIITALTAVVLAAAFTGCGEKNESSDITEESSAAVTDEAPAESETEEATEAPTEEATPAAPAECDDANAVTFDDGNISFASIKDDDPDSAQGTLSLSEIQGNPMLAFTDSGTNFADGTVQKIKIDAAKLLAPEDLAKVRSIELDVYATATAEEFVNEDKENVKAPGWIGGGGGANVSGDKWYEFSEWEGGEYNFETSGPVHVTMKFLLAATGQCWDETMEEATFQIMRWGAQNEGDMLIDNIVFLDADGNSVPLSVSTDDASADTEETEESAE